MTAMRVAFYGLWILCVLLCAVFGVFAGLLVGGLLSGLGLDIIGGAIALGGAVAGGVIGFFGFFILGRHIIRRRQARHLDHNHVD
jgi:hypothetical protein